MSFLLTLLCCRQFLAAQVDLSVRAQLADRLVAQHEWQAVADLLGPVPERSADEDYNYGTALARLDRWDDAELAFDAGARLAPHDPRFPIELAGIAFTRKHYPEAAKLLRRAVRLSPQDKYANDFLGTVYFLEGNTEASLKYWNRIGKPEVVEVRTEPVPRVAPSLLDRAFAFSPAEALELAQWIDSQERIRGLGVFPQYHVDLNARDDGKFNVVFRSHELNGFGGTKLEAFFLFLQGLPFSSVNPQYYNFHCRAINFTSMYRWDAQKRRIFAHMSAPFEGSAKTRWDIGTDLRDENWVIRNSFTGTAPSLASLNLRTERGGFGLASFASSRWNWSAGGEISHRNYRGAVPGTVLTPELLASGYQLKQLLEVNTTVLRLPERRFLMDAGVSSQAARLWSQSGESFEKLQGRTVWEWFPKAKGDDYEMQQETRAGKTFGQIPFDELFMLGLERDNDLSMHAHIGTRDGRKGSAPLGRNYFLSNWEMDKNLYGNGIFSVKLGPLLDVGKVTDPSPALGSHEWMFDTGAQAKMRVLGGGVVFSYGRDLRTGNNAFYITVLRTRRGRTQPASVP
ncbi:MAG TPA: tetratricopeptide repeat protein [Terracidiphilus sp.]|nr:tetratricopeptide repeat protein [Terracidiphilus sp.]